MTDIEILAREVLEMMSLQEIHKKNNLTARYLSKKIDPEELHKSFSEMITAQRKVYDMCCDILGIDEDYEGNTEKQ
jgi:hypothetical protein